MNERICFLLQLLGREISDLVKTSGGQCASHQLATKSDVLESEQRIIAAINAGGGSGGLSTTDQAALDELLAWAKTFTEKLEKADAQTPPATTPTTV